MRIDLKSEKPPRGVCTHEAGHAVVANSFGVPVQAIWVAFTEEKGWHGGTDHAQGSVEHLHYMDQATILMAGKTAEELFGCPAHETAWRKDLGQISVLLNANRIPEDEHWVRISEARERALSILETSRNKALKLIDRLVECGRVERPEFVRLMNGETS
jgi:ATP-dependent Zn protease